MKNLQFYAVINGTRKQFVLTAKTWSTRNSWGHEVDLFAGNNYSETTRRRYYNRTWESWEYQSAMQDAINNFVSWNFDRMRNDWKLEHGTNRIDATTSRKMVKQSENLRKRLFAHLEKANANRW